MPARILLHLLVFAIPVFAFAAEPVPLADFARHMQFKEVKISPDGAHLAVSSIIEGKVVLSIIDLASNTGLTLRPRDDDEVSEFWWVSPRRVVYSAAVHTGQLEAPSLTGELFAVDVDGKNKDTLFGFRKRGSAIAGSTGSHIQGGRPEYASATMLDTLRDDDENALIEVQRWNWSHVGTAGGEDLHAEVRRIDVKTGKTRTVAIAPLTGARFLSDHKGAVRFVAGDDAAQKRKVYYRDNDDAEWELILDEGKTGNRVSPVAFNRDDSSAYFECGGSKNRGGLCRWDIEARTFKTLWSGTESEAIGFEETFDGQDLFAIRSMPGRPAIALLDKNAPEAKILVELMGQFPGEDVHFGNASKDGKKAIVIVEADRDPGAFYLYDAEARKLTFLMARAPWVKPENMAAMEPFSIKARDGLDLHGYLARPVGKEEAKDLPLVVLVHGGPYRVHDTWRYQPTVQALTSRGYAVLQVNYRGSGGYGDAFVKAGYGEWGAKMQDDVTDATRWAIEQGVADAKRICIFGGSYGGYAALQGAVREPGLYQCAIGYVGVYDLNLMKTRGDIPKSFFGEGYLETVLGDDEKVLAQRSPISQLERLKAKVMLIVGGQDKRVPPVQGESLRSALIKRGAEPEWLYQPTEGHGFYDEANVTDMYEKVLAFLDRNIGQGKATEVASP
ncbi:alpha/beta hydrolase family protein [Dokdonella immobilis]|uniref:Dipeptidyl aminopeptidase/acylaminoacyl peptidase n=1 Tax=Dokdonella immobilis TaxID=578942 RepID=A0A1I4YG57_9GAMM|nr:S9 family peptidase [Dokdonella immobilis]SFN36783.1 Dipeptidyl aminopeptidase/acylaminoacyl peptidase [Dokdonella immobilis]